MKNIKDLAIYGAGGFGFEIACLIRQINEFHRQWNFIGFFDDNKDLKDNRYGPVLGNIDILNNWKKPLSVAIAIANTVHLKTVSRSITNQFVDFPNIIAPNVNIFDKEAFQIGIGNIIFFGCRLSCDVGIGDFNLFNGAVSLGHDVKMGSYNIVQPSVRISGNCIVGDNNFFGVQSIVLQGLKIGNNTKIGALSVVMRNTSDNASYFGNPAKKLKY
ncbi:MAG TPA: serine acetyltransferase [Candidatus Cloacimonadota bacterium]|nr:serine acetyltransferase [Candidatus Cloacimonadota bacterium]